MALGVDGVRVWVWTDPEHCTGCTVILPPAGTVGGIAVRGGAPGTCESAILGPATPNEACHAVVLCGSSLFGLRAADGVVDWCEARGIGLDLGVGRFPIVGAAVVLDIRGPDDHPAIPTPRCQSVARVGDTAPATSRAAFPMGKAGGARCTSAAPAPGTPDSIQVNPCNPRPGGALRAPPVPVRNAAQRHLEPLLDHAGGFHDRKFQDR